MRRKAALTTEFVIQIQQTRNHDDVKSVLLNYL